MPLANVLKHSVSLFFQSVNCLAQSLAPTDVQSWPLSLSGGDGKASTM